MPQTSSTGRVLAGRVSLDGVPLASKTFNANHVVFAQISALVSQLSKKNYRQTSQELSLLSTNYGNSATLAVFKNLFSKIDLKSARDQPKMQLLLQALDALSQRTNFVSLLCQAFEDMEPLPHDFLHKLSKALKLSSTQDLLIGISLLHSHRPITKSEGLKFLKSKLQDLPNLLKDKLPEPLLHEFVNAVHNPNFDAKLREASLKYLHSLYKSLNVEPMPHILTLLAEDEPALELRQMGKTGDLIGAESNAVLKQIVASLGPAQVMQDLGYPCCQDEATLKVLLRQFGRVLDESKVARILGMMCITHKGLEDGISLSLYDNAQPLIDAAALTSSKATCWNLDVLVSVLTVMCPKLDWLTVMHNLDYPEFMVNDLEGFNLLARAYFRATALPFPTHILLPKWRNLSAQLCMIKYAFEAYTTSQANNVSRASIAMLSPFSHLDALMASSPSPLCTALSAVGLVNALLNISEECGYYAPVAQFLETGRSFILLLSLVESKSNALLKEEMTAQLTSKLLLSSTEENPLKWALVERVWQLNQLAIVDTMINLYNKSSENLACILECGAKLGLDAILNLVPYTLFAMELAFRASQAHLLDLNVWIKSMVLAHSDVFVRSILQYISSRMSSTDESQTQLTMTDGPSPLSSGDLSGGLSEETMQALLLGIKVNETVLSQDAKNELALLLPQTPVVTKPNYPTSLNASTGSAGGYIVQTPVEIEADQLFQQVYERRSSTDSLLGQLRSFKNSLAAKDQQVFACMINNLFANYSYFPNYPDAELQVTATIYGGLIEMGLLEGDMQTNTLRAILNALQQPSNSRMFAFGISALSNISVARLATWPKYVATILETPHFVGAAPASLTASLRAAVTAPVPITQLPGNPKGTASPARGGSNQGGSNNSGNRNTNSGNTGSGQGNQGSGQGSAGGASGGSGAPPPGGNGGSGGGSGSGGSGDGRDTGASLSLGTLVSGLREVEQPDEETRDRIHFILNNVSGTNMTNKAADLAKVLKPQYFDYLAAQLVIHRVSTDTRFQALYLELIDLQRQPELFQKVLKTTYKAVHAILNSPKLPQPAERSLLKNLGNWLGLMTLKRNKPVMHIDLGIKDLILKGYEQGTLFAILPFVSRILLTAVDSTVFRIPNPWFVAILRLLKEIHSHPRAQQNIKFEVELLYQGIGEDLVTMPPSELLLNHTMYTGPVMKDFLADTSNGTAVASGGSQSTPHVPGSINWMPALHIHPELQIFALQPVLKQRLHAAFNKAIDDLLPEAENTVSIVPKTTLRLILKDFANEPDETKMLGAARSMAQSLASSLLHATLRNHIRNATHQTMKASLDTKTQYDTLQPQFHRAIDDNLEVASSTLAKHMVEKTLMAVEHELRPAIEARVSHREQLTKGLVTRPFSDQSQVSPLQAQLPDMLKVRPGVGATAQQTALYDVFLRLPSLVQASMEAAAQAQQAQVHATDGKMRTGIAGGTGPSGIQPKEFVDPKKVLEKLDSIISELERWASTAEGALESAPDAQIALGPLPHLTMTILRETQDRPPVATQCAVRVLDLLYTNPRSLRGPEPNPMREVYTRILFAIARSTPAVVEALTKRFIAINAGEVTVNVASSSPTNSNATTTLEPYHRELTHWLLSWQLLRCDLLDPALAAEIARGVRPAIDFALWLIKSAILGLDTSGNAGQPAGAQMTLLAGNDLPRTLAELETVLSRNRSPELQVVQSCSQVALDVNAQSRRTATHTDQLHQQAKRPTTATSSASQRQQQLLLRQQMLAKSLPQPVVALFSDWVNLWQHGTPSVEHMQQVLLPLRNLGLVSFGDAAVAESENHFLRGIIDAAVLAYLMQSQMQAHAQASLQPGVEPTPEQATYLSIQPYAAIDALAKLVVYLVKNYPEQAKILLLQRVLHQTSAAIGVDYGSNVAEFNQRPYFRLLSSLLVLMSDTSFGDKLESLFLSAFADLLLELRPQNCPGLAFAWLELVSHRLFMPKLIRHPRACFALQKLLIFHLTFLEPYLAGAKLNEAVFSLYQGTLRVFLVLIHDFPEFLCDFHHSFCDVLPPNCIQLRNLILSAFPRNVKLPDPTLNIKMEQLPTSKESPRVFNIEGELQAAGQRERFDEVLKGGDATSLFASLPSLLFHKDIQTGKPTTYNVKLINSIVLYCGIAAIADPHCPAMDIYLHLANVLDAEGRYHLFNAFANQLRYPSSHTHYFSWALLHIFSEASNDAIPEQITRVLLERYIAQKPTPWGLAITYQELTKNQVYNFWTRDFVKASPDMGRLFMNLSRRSNPR